MGARHPQARLRDGHPRRPSTSGVPGRRPRPVPPDGPRPRGDDLRRHPCRHHRPSRWSVSHHAVVRARNAAPVLRVQAGPDCDGRAAGVRAGRRRRRRRRLADRDLGRAERPKSRGEGGIRDLRQRRPVHHHVERAGLPRRSPAGAVHIRSPDRVRDVPPYPARVRARGKEQVGISSPSESSWPPRSSRTPAARGLACSSW